LHFEAHDDREANTPETKHGGGSPWLNLQAMELEGSGGCGDAAADGRGGAAYDREDYLHRVVHSAVAGGHAAAKQADLQQRVKLLLLLLLLLLLPITFSSGASLEILAAAHSGMTVYLSGK
jgi:hypothetical protein